MICFDHGIEYDGVDVLMCPQCEDEIALQHDPFYQEKEKCVQ
jgi:hypothetical protein